METIVLDNLQSSQTCLLYILLFFRLLLSEIIHI
nr:MAG TPA: hypothetical protein [Bacteriophage sp.]